MRLQGAVARTRHARIERGREMPAVCVSPAFLGRNAVSPGVGRVKKTVPRATVYVIMPLSRRVKSGDMPRD